MAVSIGFIKVRFFLFSNCSSCLILSDFDRVCGRLHVSIRACIPVSLAFKCCRPLQPEKSVFFSKLDFYWQSK